MPTLAAALVCVVLLAASELARHGAARMLGVSGARIAKYLVAPRGGRGWARVVAIVAGSVAMYLGIVALAFAFHRHEGVPTATKEYVVTEAVAGFPAAGKFTKGERVVAVNGAPLDRSLSTIVDNLGGAPVRLTVRHGDSTHDVTLEPVGHDGHWMLGLRLAEDSRSHDASLVLRRSLGFPTDPARPLRLATYVLLLVIMVDLVRAVRAVRAR